MTGSQERATWRTRSHHLGHVEFVLCPYAKRREARITAQWGFGRWPGHIRAVTPWRVLGVVWIIRWATPRESDLT